MKDAGEMYDHVHGFIQVKWFPLFAVLRFFHLPTGWLVSSGDLPHDPDCTPKVAVLRGDSEAI